MVEEKYSKLIYVIKAFSIFSVLVAHINKINNENFITSIITNWYNLFGIIGVVCFFIIGGYLYNRKEKDGKIFWKKKVKTIIIPWIIAGSITYLMHVIKMHDLNVIGYIKWVLGSGTIYYYLTNYVLFLFLFKYIQKSDKLLYLCIALTIVQSILNTFNIKYFNIPFITKYLNIFNWIGFFALGILIRKYNIIDFILTHNKILIYAIIISIILFILMYKYVIYGYFHIVSLIYEITNSVIVLYLSYWLLNNKFFNFIGKTSFCIYLYHIQIVQKICWSLPSNIFFTIINPFLGLIIMAFIIFVGMKVIEKFKYKKQVLELVGLR